MVTAITIIDLNFMQIKEGWGWSKWNIDTWETGQMKDNIGELLHDRLVIWLSSGSSVLINYSFQGTLSGIQKLEYLKTGIYALV